MNPKLEKLFKYRNFSKDKHKAKTLVYICKKSLFFLLVSTKIGIIEPIIAIVFLIEYLMYDKYLILNLINRFLYYLFSNRKSVLNRIISDFDDE